MALEQFNNGEQNSSVRTKLNAAISKVNQLDTVAEIHSEVLTFDKNKYTDTSISQSAVINYSLAASGHVDGTVIRHKILSDGVNQINFTLDFNVFGKSDNDIYPSGLHVFYFNYVGGDVDVSIPTYDGTAVADTTAPSTPTNLATTAKTETTVDLSWTASTDNVGVTGYKIYVDGVFNKEVAGTTGQVTGLTAGTAYSFTVSAIDAAGNESAQSTALSVTTTASASDTTAPTYITGYPTTANVADTTLDVQVQLNEIGKAYMVVLADAATAPTSAEVKAGTGAGGVAPISSGSVIVGAASTTYAIAASGLTASTAYDVYVVAEDDETTPNLQASPVLLDVSTKAAPTGYILDDYAGSLAAYSLRKLSANYTGFACKLIRSSDNATMDLGFDANGDLDTSSTAFTDFVGTAQKVGIHTWYDQSGNGRHKVIPTTTDVASAPVLVDETDGLIKVNTRASIYAKTSTTASASWQLWAPVTGLTTVSEFTVVKDGTTTSSIPVAQNSTADFAGAMASGSTAAPDAGVGTPSYYVGGTLLDAPTRGSLFTAVKDNVIKTLSITGLDLTNWTELGWKYPNSTWDSFQHEFERVYYPDSNNRTAIEANQKDYYGIV